VAVHWGDTIAAAGIPLAVPIGLGAVFLLRLNEKRLLAHAQALGAADEPEDVPAGR